jgi:Kef-type K+ transport system membrane component KefB
MFVLELYFIFYRVPKMMTRLARERNRSALRWSLLGMGAWIGAEFAVAFAFALVYEIGVGIWDWPRPEPAGLRLLSYVLALVAALGSATIVSRILMSKSKEEFFPTPPPPPKFSD